MQHIDLFEVPGFLYLVPDEGDTIYVVDPNARSLFSYHSRLLIENNNDYRSHWPHTVPKSVDVYVDELSSKNCHHIAGFTLVWNGECSVSTYTSMGNILSITARRYVGSIIADIACGHLSLMGSVCFRCLGSMYVIGSMDLGPDNGQDLVQNTIIEQCSSCGQYKHSVFDNGLWVGSHNNNLIWVGNQIGFSFVRLLPDPYVCNGRLSMVYTGMARRLCLDGDLLDKGQDFELYYDGEYRHGRLDHVYDRFSFMFSEDIQSVFLLPGMQAHLLL